MTVQVNSLTAIRVPAGTKNSAGRTFQVGKYLPRRFVT
jgi:hypothetical protein